MLHKGRENEQNRKMSVISIKKGAKKCDVRLAPHKTRMIYKEAVNLK